MMKQERGEYALHEILNSMFLPRIKKYSYRAKEADTNMSLCFRYEKGSAIPFVVLPQGQKN